MSSVCSDINLPNEFKLRRSYTFWKKSAYVTSMDQSVEYLYLQHECPEISYSSMTVKSLPNKEQVGYSKGRWLHWGMRYDIFDCEDNLLYVVDEVDIVLSRLQLAMSVEVRDASGEVLGGLLKSGIIGKDLELMDAETGEVVVTGVFPLQIDFTPEWTIEVLNSSSPMANPLIVSTFMSSYSWSDDGSETCSSLVFSLLTFGMLVACAICMFCLCSSSRTTEDAENSQDREIALTRR